MKYDERATRLVGVEIKNDNHGRLGGGVWFETGPSRRRAKGKLNIVVFDQQSSRGSFPRKFRLLIGWFSYEMKRSV